MSKKRKKKILWISEYRMNTGFSNVSESILKYLAEHFDITLLDIYRTLQGKYSITDNITEDSTIKVVGRYAPNDTWALYQAIEICDQFDAIFILQDIWNIDEILTVLKECGKKIPPVVIYFPIDMVDHDKDWYKNFEMVKTAVTYTKFARQEVGSCLGQLFGGSALDEQLDKLSVIPHGTDSDRFYKLPETKAELRQQIFSTDQFNDGIIFLNANRNQNRKRLDLTMKGFQLFVEKNDVTDAYLYMHCGNIDSHIDVQKMAARYGISQYLIQTTDGKGVPQSTTAELNKIYNACDIGVNTSIGEGWGLCSTEHAATGAPQIVPSHSACHELFSDIVTPIYAPTSYTVDNYMITGKLVDPYDLAEKMYILYSRKDIREEQGQLCFERFTSPEYQWQNICKVWKNIFDSV